MKLVVGLGNPGDQYVKTRHNIGFRCLEEVANCFGLPNFTLNKKINGLFSKGKINKTVAILVKPLTFMNNSGFTVKAALSFFKIKPEDVVIIHDDKDIPLGEARVQNGRGSAGHNGVKSIIEELGSNEFTRIRVGIAPKNEKIASTPDFVLDRFSKEEESELRPIMKKVTEEIRELM